MTLKTESIKNFQLNNKDQSNHNYILANTIDNKNITKKSLSFSPQIVNKEKTKIIIDSGDKQYN